METKVNKRKLSNVTTDEKKGNHSNQKKKNKINKPSKRMEKELSEMERLKGYEQKYFDFFLFYFVI